PWHTDCSGRPRLEGSVRDRAATPATGADEMGARMRTKEMTMDSKKLTRRAVLERGAALGLVVIGAGAGLSACGGGELDCSSPMGLTPEQRTQRQALAYVDRTPNPTQRCEVCNFYTAPTQP